MENETEWIKGCGITELDHLAQELDHLAQMVRNLRMDFLKRGVQAAAHVVKTAARLREAGDDG